MKTLLSEDLKSWRAADFFVRKAIELEDTNKQLLEALESVLKCGRGSSGRIILEKEDEQEIIAAIAAAKGE